MRLEKGSYLGLSKESYLWLKERGVSNTLIRQIASDPMHVYNFYRPRVDMGKSFAQVPKEHQEEVLRAILEFAKSQEK